MGLRLEAIRSQPGLKAGPRRHESSLISPGHESSLIRVFTTCRSVALTSMRSRGRAPPQGRHLRIRTDLVLTVVLFSLLGLAHALQPKEWEELDPISEEIQQTRNAPDDVSVRLVEKINDIHGRLNMFEEELDQTREHVAETSLLTTRSVETLLWDLRAATRRLSALENRLAAQELESRRAAETRAVNAAKGKAARRKEAAEEEADEHHAAWVKFDEAPASDKAGETWSAWYKFHEEQEAAAKHRSSEACSVNAAKGKAARRKEAAQVLRPPPGQQ